MGVFGLAIMSLAIAGEMPSMDGQAVSPEGRERQCVRWSQGIGPPFVTLRLFKDETFEYAIHGCFQYDVWTGKAEVRGDNVSLTATTRPEGRDNELRDTEFTRVAWGDRLYLIPNDEAQAFCNAVNLGTEPRGDENGRFFLRDGDWEKKPIGSPAVPKSWERYLLKQPIRGQVVEALPGSRARINLGSRDGVFEGMMLSDDGGRRDLRVEAVAERHSTVHWPASDGRAPRRGVGVVSRYPRIDSR